MMERSCIRFVLGERLLADIYIYNGIAGDVFISWLE